MFGYTICDSFCERIFFSTCRALETRIPNISKGLSLHDVDDSRIQLYTCGIEKIKVVNDYPTDAVYAEVICTFQSRKRRKLSTIRAEREIRWLTVPGIGNIKNLLIVARI